MSSIVRIFLKYYLWFWRNATCLKCWRLNATNPVNVKTEGFAITDENFYFVDELGKLAWWRFVFILLYLKKSLFRILNLIIIHRGPKTFSSPVLQENHQRVNIFFDYAKKTKNTAWSYFLPMLNRQDLFTVHMVSYSLDWLVPFSHHEGQKHIYRP